MMRAYLNGIQIADKLNAMLEERITVFVEGQEKKRKATKREKELLAGILGGAINAMNWGESIRGDDAKAEAIIECAEFTAIRLLPHVQSYLSIYCPLQKVLRKWERE